MENKLNFNFVTTQKILNIIGYIYSFKGFEILVHEAFVAGNLIGLPKDEWIELQHHLQLSLETIVHNLTNASSDLPRNFLDVYAPGESPFDEPILQWNQGELISFSLAIGKNGTVAGTQTLVNIWPLIELYSPDGTKIESLSTSLDDLIFQEKGSFIPTYTHVPASGQAQELTRETLILKPADDARIDVKDYSLTQTTHIINPHSYYAGKYKLKYQFFLFGPPNATKSIPFTSPKELRCSPPY